MTTTILQPCIDAVTRIADDIAANGPACGSTRSLEQQIAHVRQVSIASQRELRDVLAPAYPEVGWTDEEDRPTSAAYWLYDAIDGAYHYLQGLPLWASSLVLVRDGEPVLAIVYDPTRREVFIAEAGAGAWCNGSPIRVSGKATLSHAVVATANPPLIQVGAEEQAQAMRLTSRVAKSVFVVRSMAAVSLQLAYTAAGRLDAYWENGRDTADWLAGALVVREAGGVVTDLRGDAFGWNGEGILAGNRKIHGGLLAQTREELNGMPGR